MNEIEAEAKRRGISTIELLSERHERMRAAKERRPLAPRRLKETERPSVAPSPGLAAGFRARGMSAESAKIAANGRKAKGSRSLREEALARGMSPAAAAVFARGRTGIHEAVTKHEDPAGNFKGGDFPASDYAYTPDENDPETWRYLLTMTPGGEPSGDAVKAAVQALDPNNPLHGGEVPADEIPALAATLAAAWTRAGLSADAMPDVLTQEAARQALEAAGRRLGYSDRALEVFVKGRR